MIIISIHIFPHEIKRFQGIVETFENSIKYLDDTSDILLDVSLNTNPTLIDWKSETHDNIVNSFKGVCSKISVKSNCNIHNNEMFLGVNEHRRITIKNSNDSDTIIFLDSDLHFDETLLANQLNAVEHVKHINEYYIITPQIIKLWDNTWDCIVNHNFLKKSHDYYKTANAHEIANTNYGPVGLKPNDTFKWGGGWFNAISANLLKYIGIPKSFVGYGPDDTFVMECCKIMKTHNKNIQQYILTNMVVVENRQPIKSSTTLKTNTQDFRANCNKQFATEVSAFRGKL
tara:strand:- start:1814 stop:2674 length:861 start_codon:yes stop_codon:yes gene_type:complete